MPTIRIVRRHSMSHHEIRAEVEHLAAELRQKMQADYHWEGETLCFSRTGANGTIQVQPGSLAIEIKLGIVLSPMRSHVERIVTEYLDERLG